MGCPADLHRMKSAIEDKCYEEIPLICQSLCNLAVGSMRWPHPPLRKDKEVIAIECWATETPISPQAQTGRQALLRNHRLIAICVCYCSVCLWKALVQL